jgi:hypothetical protein
MEFIGAFRQSQSKLLECLASSEKVQQRQSLVHVYNTWQANSDYFLMFASGEEHNNW